MTINLESIKKSLGRVIKINRTKKNWNGEKLAQEADTTQNYISKIERGEFNPSFVMVAKIAAALDVPLSQLFKEVEELEKEGE